MIGEYARLAARGWDNSKAECLNSRNSLAPPRLSCHNQLILPSLPDIYVLTDIQATSSFPHSSQDRAVIKHRSYHRWNPRVHDTVPFPRLETRFAYFMCSLDTDRACSTAPWSMFLCKSSKVLTRLSRTAGARRHQQPQRSFVLTGVSSRFQ